MFLQRKLMQKKKADKKPKDKSEAVAAVAKAAVAEHKETAKDEVQDLAAAVAEKVVVSVAPPEPKAKASKAGLTKAMVVVDTMSTGGVLAKEFNRRGLPVVRIFSRAFPPSLMHGADLGFEYAATIQHQEGNWPRTMKLLADLPFELVGCVAGCETGIDVADKIAEDLKLRGNGTAMSRTRRDKYLMGEQVRRCGVRAVIQAIASRWSEVKPFLLELNPQPFRVIIKPIESAGSDGVYLCKSEEELRMRFDELLGELNVLGEVNTAVVVQEYLEGTEYVVDTVSRDGVHKVATIYEYDKRPANGKSFIYFEMRIVSGDEPVAKQLVDYMFPVLDALGIVNGPGHGEVKLVRGKPCLVEVGSRPHGASGSWLPIPTQCLGYSQISLSVDVYLNPKRFLDTPALPMLRKHGAEGYIVNTKHGVIKALPRLDEIRSLPSLVNFIVDVEPGDKVHPTVDCVDTMGTVVLVAENYEKLRQDLDTFRAIESSPDFYEWEDEDATAAEAPAMMTPLMRTFTPSASVARSLSSRTGNLLHQHAHTLAGSVGSWRATSIMAPPGSSMSSMYENTQLMTPAAQMVMSPASFKDSVRIGSLPKSQRAGARTEKAVVVVDPLSTGAALAKEFDTRGMNVIRVFSRYFPEALMNMLPEGMEMDFSATIQHEGDESGEKGLLRTVKLLQSLPFKIVGCTSGAETGVEVTEALCERLGLRGNGTALAKTRRDKYLMGEQVRRCGVRAVMQARVNSWEDIPPFVSELNPSPFRVIIKPVDSAGSDGVYLCKSMEELRDKYQLLMGEMNALGTVNTSVVVQEYLEGKEYVVDMVSRDGVHKCCAVWEYDKRVANGHNFVYFGMKLMPGEGERQQAMIAYMKKVCNALQLRNGPSHGEVKWTPTGPCLVEVGARPHGGEGTWTPIAMASVGYSQVTLTADVHVAPDRFFNTPDVYTCKEAHGYEVYFVNPTKGRIKAYRKEAEDLIRKLPSCHRLDWLAKVGDVVPITVDCMTCPGSVVLINKDKAQLEADYLAIREVEHNLFHFEASAEDDKAEADMFAMDS